jgi:multiple sugar transport system permease protein
VALLVFLPSVVVMLALGLYPILRVLSFSLYKVDVFLKTQEFTGLDNLIKVITWDDFWGAVWNDVVFTGVSIIFQIIVGIFVAVLLNRKFLGRDIARGVIMFSYLVPIVVAALVWRFMLNDIVGIVNYIIEVYNLPIPTTWFGAVQTAMPTVIMVNVWKFFPFMVLVFLAQLQSIDPVLYEAAKVDGSSAWQEFWHITLPVLKPVILIAAMLRTIWHFNDFAVIQLLTGGGPLGSTETPPLMIYDIVFATWNLGRGSAVAVVMFLILILMSLVYIRLYHWAQGQLS